MHHDEDAAFINRKQQSAECLPQGTLMVFYWAACRNHDASFLPIRRKSANDFENPPRISANLPMISETPALC
jgi:hypothetical protein